MFSRSLFRLAVAFMVILAVPVVGAAPQDSDAVAPLPAEAVAPPWSVEEARQRLGGEEGIVWRDGEVLHALCRAEAERVTLGGGLQEAMQRLGESDLWALSMRIENLDKAVVTYACAPSGKPYPHGDQLRAWRGPEAPTAPRRVSRLEGSLVETAIRSQALGELRRITVYRPPGEARRPLPTVYLTDGQMLEELAQVVEPAVIDGRLPPLLLVGTHAMEYDGDVRVDYDPARDRRSLDYLAGYEERYLEEGAESSRRFARHREFFLREARKLAEEQYGASRRRLDRLVFGVSNGGAFSVVTAIEEPREFGGAIALSAGWSPSLERQPVACGRRCPSLYLAAGTLETRFYSTTSKWAAKLQRWASRLHFRDDRVSGHDSNMWAEELLAGLIWYFEGR